MIQGFLFAIGALASIAVIIVLILYIAYRAELIYNNWRTPSSVFVTSRKRYKRMKYKRGSIRGGNTKPYGVFSCDRCRSKWVSRTPQRPVGDSSMRYRVTCPVCEVTGDVYPTGIDLESDAASWLREQGVDL